jgi:hypothetical protein
MQNLQNFVNKNSIQKLASEIPPTPLYQRGTGGISGNRWSLGKADSSGCGYAALCPLWFGFDNTPS